MTLREFAATLESTLLDAGAGERRVEELCGEAVAAGFAGVCVSPCRAACAARHLAGTPVRLVSVAGFPLGTQTTRTKVAEVAELVALGAAEVDVVFNQGWFLEGRLMPLAEELREVRRAAAGALLKVILETGTLLPGQVREAAALALGAGADYLKTSTGYAPVGARVEDVRLLAQVAAGRCGVKAAGGIRSFAQARELLRAGADRIGTSRAGTLWEEAQATLAGEPGGPP